MSDSKGSNRMKVVEIGGTPYDMGFRYGEACPEISAMLDGVYNMFGSREKALDLIEKYVPLYLPAAEVYAPEIVEEMKGMAAGAKVDFRDIFFLNITYELAMPSLMGCTSYALGPTATVDGEVIAGQNFDYVGVWQDSMVLLKMRPVNGPAMMAFAPVGCLGLIGFNSAGISLNLNLVRNKSSLAPVGGVPSHIILRKVLSSENLGQAIGSITSAEGRSAKNYLLTSAQGDIVDVEVTADDIDISYPEDGILTHANHFKTERFKPDDLAPVMFPDSYVRSQRLLDLLKSRRGRLSVEVLRELLQDHNNYPNSICRHPDPQNPFPMAREMKTLVSIISCPGKQKAYIALGNPCQSEYLEYGL